MRVPWTARRPNQSILKEINPEYSLEGLMLKLKLQYFGHMMQRTDSSKKTLNEWIQKQDPYICCLQETHLKTGDTYRLKVKGWKKIFHTNRDQKKA